MNLIEDSIANLEKYLEREKYMGYDPYDILNSFIPFKKLGKWPSAIATQIQKRNPINIRPFLGIKKGINPKAFGLFLQSYSLLYKKTNNDQYLQKANYFFNWLNENYSKGFSGKCWGYNFPWANPIHYYESYTPSAVVTAFVVRGVWEYYLVTKSEKAKELILNSSLFILKDIPITVEKYGICFSYTPLQKDLCFNSSLLAAEILARAYVINEESELKEKVINAVNWVINYQNKNGKWNYSIDPITRKERVQIDFHQGFILESIYLIKNLLNINNSNWELSIKTGMKFYKEHQFFSNGVSKWRLPKKWPVEIHNQAQGIITFIKLSEYYTNSNEFASTIAKWTIQNMQAKDGHFYYHNFKFHKHKISYMRWSNAWMFLSLVSLLEQKNKNNI